MRFWFRQSRIDSPLLITQSKTIEEGLNLQGLLRLVFISHDFGHLQLTHFDSDICFFANY